MNDFIKKQTSVDLNKDLQEQELSFQESLEELKQKQTPEYLFYKGYIDGCEDYDNHNSLLFEAFPNKNKHYLAGYKAAQDFTRRLPEIYKQREYYRKRLEEYKKKNNLN